jgi:hypothetical protein
MGELLGGRSAPRDPQHIALSVPMMVEQLGRQAGDAAEAVGPARQRRMAHPGNVEGEQLAPGHQTRDRLEQFDVGADAVEQQQGRAAGRARPAADPQQLPADADHADRKRA